MIRLLLAWTIICAALLPAFAQFGNPSQFAIPVKPVSCSSTTLNPADKGAAISLSGGNLIATGTGAGSWQSVRTVASHATGKLYFEVKWTTADTNVVFGMMDGTGSVANFVGVDTHSGGYFVAGNVNKYNSADTAAGFVYATNDVFGVAIDVTNSLFWVQDWTAATGWFGSAAGNPATGTNGFALSTIGNPLFAAGSSFGVGSITFNFGASAFTGTVPTGFTGCF